MRSTGMLVAAAALVALQAGAAVGQTLHGTLTDETTNQPVAGATVLLVDPAGRRQGETRTDAAGAWTMEAPSPGALYAVRARKEGFATVDTRPFRARRDTPPLALVTRPEIPVLEAVSAPAINYESFLERRRRGLGVSLGPDEVRRRIDRVGAVEPSRLLWGLLPGLQKDPTTQEMLVPARGGGSGCTANFVIDGKRYESTFMDGSPRVPPWEIDELVSISEIRAVEIYPSPLWVPMATRWIDWSVARCGVIVVWTYRGIGVD